MNQNKVTLLGYYGGDETHCLSAWTSTFSETGIELPENIYNRTNTLYYATYPGKRSTPEQLLSMLAKEKHHTPFEKSLLHFQILVEDASHIQSLKHRIGVSINGESARYKELMEDRFYIPHDWPEDAQKELEHYSNLLNSIYHKYVDKLTPLLGRDRAKESARFFKMKNSQIILDVSFNFRSFMHFQGLRYAPKAQLEIREIAQSMLQQVREIPGNPFELSLKAFGYGQE